jgi:hypothetical protein
VRIAVANIYLTLSGNALSLFSFKEIDKLTQLNEVCPFSSEQHLADNI